MSRSRQGAGANAPIHAIAMLEHSLHVAKSRYTRGDIRRGADQSAKAIAAARGSTPKAAVNYGRSNKGTIPCSEKIRKVSEFDRSTSGGTTFFTWGGKLYSGPKKVRVCKA